MSFVLRQYPWLTYYLLIPGLLLLMAAGARAELEHSFSGFGTLGLAFNDNADLVFRRDVTQNDGAYNDSTSWITDSLVGVQWQGRWSPEWETTLQLVAKDRFKNTLENSIEWAFIRYRPIDGFDVRVGRMGADVFMLSEYRQVGYAMPWVRPPHDYYGIASLYNFDGIDINRRWVVGDAMLNIKGFFGNSDEEYPTGYQSESGTKFDFDLLGLTTSLDWNYWKLRYTYAQVTVNSDQGFELRSALQQLTGVWPAAAEVIPALQTRDKKFDYSQVGFNFDNNTWWVQSEFVRLRSEVGLVSDGEHFYASAGRRFGNLGFYLLGGYAEPRGEIAELSAPAGLPAPLATQLNMIASATERSLNGVRIKQHSYGLGTRWDFASKMALKFQIEQFAIDQTGTNLWLRLDNTAEVTEDQQATLVSMALDVLF
ncbi:MAG TPA: hypothetical protein VLC79_12255 [Cellvibrio sp.]|nr:hypothetical protein [Cellvibrio sp.]